ncbi:DUF1679 domain-containing protein [Rhodococcus sp. WS4]|nr:DUF1679 domain-containing protein [Rhodococcus sp. WS4]
MPSITSDRGPQRRTSEKEVTAIDTNNAAVMGSPVGEPDELTSDWLTAALRRDIADVSGVNRIGTGQMSRTYRVGYDGSDGAQTVIAKLPANDADSLATARHTDIYLREVSFYRELAPQCHDAVAQCHFSAHDPETNLFTLLLEDVPGATVIDQLEGCDLLAARRVVTTIAAVQGAVLDSEAVHQAPWLNRATPFSQQLFGSVLPGFKDRYADSIDPQTELVLDRFGASLDAWNAHAEGPRGLQHGDCRLDNILLSPTRCALVDWQTAVAGSPLADLAYFLGGSMTVEVRRRNERELVDQFHAELTQASGREVSVEWCREEY